jgi:tetratricopeptide (TPR) repeat protein
MKDLVSLLTAVAVTLMIGTVISVVAQQEGGGGGRASISFSAADTSVKRRAKPAVKRTVPKRIPIKKSAAEYEAEANRLYEQKDYDSALVAYQNASRLKPSFNSFYRTGWLHNDFDEYDKAVLALDQAIALDSTQSVAFAEKGYALRRLKRNDEAIAALKMAISLDPQASIAPFELGALYNEAGKYVEAIRYLRQAIQNRSDYVEAYSELGLAQRRQGRFNDALDSFNTAIRLGPEDSDGYMGLGDVYFYGLKDYSKAIDPYVKGLSYEPDNRVALYNVGYSLNDIERYADALGYLEKAVQLKADDYKSYAEIGYANLQLKNAVAAIAGYQKALQYKPDHATSLFGIGDVNYDIYKKYDVAVEYYKKGLVYDPENASALYRLGFSYNDLGLYDQAISALLKVRSLRPGWKTVPNELGYAYLMQKRYDEAASMLKQAIALDRDYQLPHYYLGQTYCGTGNKAAATAEYRELQRLNSQYATKLNDLIRKM